MISIQLIEYEDKINGKYKVNDGTGSSNHILKNYFTIEHGYLKMTLNQNLIADKAQRFSSEIRVIILISNLLESSPAPELSKPKEEPRQGSRERSQREKDDDMRLFLTRERPTVAINCHPSCFIRNTEWICFNFAVLKVDSLFS